MRPRNIGVHILHPLGKERPALTLAECDHVGHSASVCHFREVERTAQQIEVKPGPGVQAAQHPLPSVNHPVPLLRSLAVQDAR